MVLISAFEANALRNVAQEVKAVSMNIYKPNCNLGYKSMDTLDFFTFPRRAAPPIVPTSLIVQLRLFSGSLYFRSYEEYLDACNFLGLATEKAQHGWKLAGDGFILQDGQGRIGAGCGIRESPVAFMRSLMTNIRRNGEGIDKTHMGKMLEGRVLTRSELDAP